MPETVTNPSTIPHPFTTTESFISYITLFLNSNKSSLLLDPTQVHQ